MSEPSADPTPERQKQLDVLREFCLSFPDAYEEHPWGHSSMKVRKKTFVFLYAEGHDLKVSAKLPHSSVMALAFPFSKPTGYGLGKSGWVSAGFGEGDDVPLPLMYEWIEESYRAIAPKKLVKQLDADDAAG